MSTAMIWQTISIDSDATRKLGELLGNKLSGGELIELVADLGGGKTTFTQGLAKGVGSKDTISSPTFTLNKIYKGRGGLEIHHFDFYRLSEPGIIADQLAESVNDNKVITVVEWSDIVKNVLPDEHISIELKPRPTDPDEREIIINYPETFEGVVREVETEWQQSRP